MNEFRNVGPRPICQGTPPAEHELLTDPSAGATSGQYPMTNHGAGAVTAPRLVLVWFGDDPSRPQVEQFAQDLANAGIVLSVLSGFGVQQVTYLASIVVPALPAGTYQLADLAARVQQLVTAGTLPANDGSTLYAAFTPDGVTIDAGGNVTSCQNWCGIHDSFNGLYVSAEPATDCDPCHGAGYTPLQARQAVLFHEFCEFATDAAGAGWYNDQSGMEVGDVFAWQPITSGPYLLQPICGVHGERLVPLYTQPAPRPQFTPDPREVADLGWFGQASAGLLQSYQNGDFGTVVHLLQQMATYADQQVAYLTAIQAHPAPPVVRG